VVCSLILISVPGCKRIPQPPAATSSESVLVKEPPEDYVEIDTTKRELRVCRGKEVIGEFPEIRLGRAGAGIKKKQGDGVTPLGSFSIGWINKSSKFHIFIGLNYPSIEYAKTGLATGIISQKEFELITRAQQERTKPPQDTKLGGLIGLHGIGKGSLKIHKLVNWTEGCIALENKQIEKLVKIVHLGMKTVIREGVEGHCLSARP